MELEPQRPDSKYYLDGRITDEYRIYVLKKTHWIKKMKKILFPKCCKKLTELNQKHHPEGYWYMLTFTFSTELFPGLLEPASFHDDILSCTIGRRDLLGLLHFEYAKEQHCDGRVHYHAAVLTSHYLPTSRFKTFNKKYGKFGCKIDKSNYRNPTPLDSIRKYINKVSPSIILIGDIKTLTNIPP